MEWISCKHCRFLSQIILKWVTFLSLRSTYMNVTFSDHPRSCQYRYYKPKYIQQLFNLSKSFQTHYKSESSHRLFPTNSSPNMWNKPHLLETSSWWSNTWSSRTCWSSPRWCCIWVHWGASRCRPSSSSWPRRGMPGRCMKGTHRCLASLRTIGWGSRFQDELKR